MSAFLVGFVLLILGYVFYGRVVSAALPPDPSRPTPAYAWRDGVDYVPMSTWRVFLIQLLNIAGLGPVFGPILGALWGPQVMLWVVFGCILGGAVHDLLAGGLSVRNNGAGLPELIGHYLGKTARHITTFFILLLMVLVGTVFVKGPAGLIVRLVPASAVGSVFGETAQALLEAKLFGTSAWLWIVMIAIFLYYVLATLLPIDKLIGRVYPFFGAALLCMVLGLLAAIVFRRIEAPAFDLRNHHPAGTAAWPIIFITVSCGAISGFHATQSPMMARCITNERHMRLVFYGAMIVEGLIALIWATASAAFYGGVPGLAAAMGPSLNPAIVVHQVCEGTMGVVGGALAVLGVVALPITSGDTAFRAGRLIAADYLKLPQRRVADRYKVALPLFALSLLINLLPFGIVWRYFGWANQTLAAVTLWACAVALARRNNWWWIAALPATFMTVMTFTYILVEKRQHGCVGMDRAWGTGIGLLLGALCLAWFVSRLGALRRAGEKPALSPSTAPASVPTCDGV